MLSTAGLLWLGLSTSLISATPIRELVTEANLRKMVNRDVIGEMVDSLPSCDDDPSFANVQSGYTDGEGVYIATSCNNNEALWKWKCWTDVYLVEWQYEYTGWDNKGLDIDCSTTSNCQRMTSELGQSCTAHTDTWDNGFRLGLEGKMEKIAEKFGVTGKIEYSHNEGGSEQTQTCTSTSDGARCTWDDQGCHAFWAAQRNHRIHGYARRTCTTGRDGTNMNQWRESDGYWTVGMRDFSVLIPDSYIVGCGALCGATEYPDPNPGGDTKAYPVEP